MNFVWISLIKMAHLLCGTVFLGIVIAVLFYIARAFSQHDVKLLRYSVKAGYFGDAIILLSIPVQLLTSIQLVSAANLDFQTRWIRVAYGAFGFIILLWMASWSVRRYKLSAGKLSPAWMRVFYGLHTVMIVVFIVIIHDAVMHSTLLSFLFGK